MSAIYAPVAMLVAALSSSIILFLSSSVYLSASVPVTIVLMVSSLFVAGNIFSVSIQGMRKTRIFLMASSAALLSNFVISVLLIPRFGMVGASIGYSSITAVSFFVMYYYVKNFGVLKFDAVKIAKIYTAGFVMFLVIMGLQGVFLYCAQAPTLYYTRICHLYRDDKGDEDVQQGGHRFRDAPHTHMAEEAEGSAIRPFPQTSLTKRVGDCSYCFTPLG